MSSRKSLQMAIGYEVLDRDTIVMPTDTAWLQNRFNREAARSGFLLTYGEIK